MFDPTSIDILVRPYVRSSLCSSDSIAPARVRIEHCVDESLEM
jgi:hypothetical protein